MKILMDKIHRTRRISTDHLHLPWYSHICAEKGC